MGRPRLLRHHINDPIAEHHILGRVRARLALELGAEAAFPTGGGDAFIKPTTPNSAAVLEFKSGQIAGGSEPAPYDIEMVQDGGTVLLSEPGVTTLLVVAQSFLSAHPAVVADLLKANLQALSYGLNGAGEPALSVAGTSSESFGYTSGSPLVTSNGTAAGSPEEALDCACGLYLGH